jgi:membrane protease YdiL (CAAX protease family)
MIISIALASIVGGNGYYLFYNIVYGILLSTVLPLWLTYRESGTLESLGIKKLGKRQVLVIIGFVVFSIGGQFIPLDISSVDFSLLSVGVVPLIMTTFFEEFLFRGFMQTRLEKQYGWISAVLLSGFFFSVYHLGYPGFRGVGDLLLLFAVGIGFTLAFKLSGGNVIVSYFVNLPNAFLTYILKFEQFPPFDNNTTPVAGITIVFIIILITIFIRKLNARYSVA